MVSGDDFPMPKAPAGTARRRIVAGARRHFFAHGFRRVTMDDLAAELGMSKKTLYTHFPAKAELVEAAIDAKFRELDNELRAIGTAGPADFPGEFRRLVDCVRRHTSDIAPPFLDDVRRAEPELFRRIEARRTGLLQRSFGRLFADGRRAGMVRKDVPPTVVIEILLVALHAVLTPQKLTELGLTPRAGFTAVLAVILNGVLVADGRNTR